MARPVLIDLRNIYSDEEIEEHGFLYVGVGRSASRGSNRL
jgi:hypothetical protein